ncbi:IclR family transcriptional regulator [Amycolatopsis sacchari]|uniref:IclR family transcriptional regulator n=1 Tax=Amycolatopsis sacchari TaxID=115433 RepID=UPI003D706A28
MLQTIRKIGPVLDLFTTECADWGVAEVAAALGIPRSSAHALLASLVETGLLRSRGRGRYRVGWRVVELGETLRGATDVRGFARPVMTELVRRFGETTQLAVWDRGRVLYVDRVAGTHPGSVLGVRGGARLAPHTCAAGRALLAFRERAEVERYVAALPGGASLAAELRKIALAGCAFGAGEAVTEVHTVAAPVRDEFGGVGAALTVTAPASRFLPRRAELRRAVSSAATELSTRLALSGG